MEIPGEGRAFHLRRNFSIAGGTAVLLVTLLIAATYYRTQVAEHVELAEARNVMLAQTFANTLWPSYGGHLTRAFGSGDAIRGTPENASLDAAVRAMSRNVPVVKIKIYNLAGTAVYSTVGPEIGEDKRANPLFRVALTGKAVSELTHRGSMSASEGTIENVDVVSSYIPIRGPAGEATAVFELYSDVTQLLDRVQRTTWHLAAGLVLIFTGLYAVLLLIVTQAERTLQGEYQALRDQQAVPGKSEAAATAASRTTTPPS